MNDIVAAYITELEDALRQKVHEVTLIQARLDGFNAAVQMLTGVAISKVDIVSKATTTKEKSARNRRNVGDLILRELNFSGAKSAVQIANAISYTRRATEVKLQRLQEARKIEQDRSGKWQLTRPNGELTAIAAIP